MARTTLQVLLAASLVALAGCTGGIVGNAQADTGTVDLYVSDEPNAMDDFEHLNVTISSVGFHQVGENGSENSSEDGRWVEREVDNETVVDLTELRGANATLLEQYELENGTYDTVFVYVEEIDATLTTGESVNVKLPSEKLHVNQQFTVGNGSETDFVFDISVHKAGNSGKYILKPVVSESGTDVPIEPVGEEEGDDDERDENGERGDDGNETDAPALDIAVDGNVTTGENVTATVTQNGTAVANATVLVDGEVVGSTAADGTITIEVPNGDEFEIEVEKGDMEGEREL